MRNFFRRSAAVSLCLFIAGAVCCTPSAFAAPIPGPQPATLALCYNGVWGAVDEFDTPTEAAQLIVNTEATQNGFIHLLIATDTTVPTWVESKARGVFAAPGTLLIHPSMVYNGAGWGDAPVYAPYSHGDLYVTMVDETTLSATFVQAFVPWDEWAYATPLTYTFKRKTVGACLPPA